MLINARYHMTSLTSMQRIAFLEACGFATESAEPKRVMVVDVAGTLVFEGKGEGHLARYAQIVVAASVRVLTYVLSPKRLLACSASDGYAFNSCLNRLTNAFRTAQRLVSTCAKAMSHGSLPNWPFFSMSFDPANQSGSR